MKMISKKAALTVFSVLAVSCFAAEMPKQNPAKTPAPAIPQTDLLQGKPAPAVPVTFDSVLSFLPEVIAEYDETPVVATEKHDVKVTTKITKQEILDFLKAKGANPELFARQPEALRKQVIAGVVEQYIDQKLIAGMAIADGFKANQKTAEELFDLMVKSIPPEQLAKVEAQMKMQGKDLKSYKAEFIKQPANQKEAAVMMWIEKKFRSTAKVTDAEITDFYNKNREYFTMPETVTASHILIVPDKKEKDTAKADKDAKEKAEKILASLKQGADFGATAEKESACPSGKQAKGSLGAFTKGQMVPEFEKAAFALKPGEMSGLVKTSFGYHIIKVTAKTPASVSKLEEVRPKIENHLMEQKISEAVKAALDKEKKAKNLKVTPF